MNELTLKQYCEIHGQQGAADVIGCTQGAVSQMLKANRDINFCIDGDTGEVSYYERKKPGRSSAAA